MAIGVALDEKSMTFDATTLSFVATKVFPALCYLEKSGKPSSYTEGVRGESDWQLTREGLLQFLVDVQHLLNIMDESIERHREFKHFGETGPMERTARVAKDVTYMSRLMKKRAPPPASGVGLAYGDYLTSLAETNKPAFVAHYFNFYQEWTIASRHLMTSVASKLNIPKHFNIGFYDGDTKLLQITLDVVSESWPDDDKNCFLRGLQVANRKAMCLASSLMTAKTSRPPLNLTGVQ